MHLVTVIPLKRKLPEGSLSYITTTKIPIGSIISVPIKKKNEYALVVESVPAIDAKNYLKSLPYSLVKLNNPDILNKLDKKFLESLILFSKFSLCELSSLIRSITKSYDPNYKNQKIENLIISSKIDTINKEKYRKEELFSYHNFINPWLNNNIKKLEVFNPEDLAQYGQAFLGYDPTIFLAFICSELKIEFTINSKLPRLRYTEWGLVNTYKKIKSDKQVNIISREEEQFSDKSNALNNDISDILKSLVLENKQILILTTKSGFASKTICVDCSTIYTCNNLINNEPCKENLYLVKNNKNFAKKYGVAGEYIYICKKCNIAQSSIVKCRNCNSWNMLALGYGKEKVIEDLYKILGKNYKNIYDSTERISKTDFNNWQKNGGIQLISYSTINEVANTDVLIVPSINSLLYGQNFESTEKIFYLLKNLEICNDKMYIVVQNKQEEEFISQDYNIWKKEELKDRKHLSFPPYARFLEIDLGQYFSKNEKVINSIIKSLSLIALPGSCNSKKNIYGEITIYTSFNTQKYNLNTKNIEIANQINEILLPFKKYLKLRLY